MQLIFDLNNLAYRCLFACRRDIDDVGFKFLQHVMYRTVFSTCRKFKPDEVILCVDDKQHWRKKIYPDYKGNRKEKRDSTDIDWNEFFASYEEFVEACKTHFPFKVLKVKYAEADDLIGILAKTYPEKQQMIVSADKDLVQLLRHKNVKLFDPIKNKQIKVDDPVRELKIKCLMGDKSDNIPAIKPRTGIKTAEKLADNPADLKKLFESEEGVEIKENYKRNIKLIDLNRIPDVLVESLIKKYENYDLPDGQTIFTYFVKNKFRDLLNSIEDLDELCTRLVKENNKVL